jgi:hypothetical protein
VREDVKLSGRVDLLQTPLIHIEITTVTNE